MHKKPFKAFGDWFYYTLSERKAAFYLCGIIIILSLFPFAYDHFIRPKARLVVQEQLINQLEKAESSTRYTSEPSARQKRKNINDATWKDMINIGIQKKLANSIINYRNALKGFSSSDQIEKVYGISKQDIALLKKEFILPSKRLDQETESKPLPSAKAKYETIEPSIVNINLADSMDFVTLPGIGPYYTSKILRFRRALGGFYAIEQLGEIYGLPDSVITAIQPLLICEGDLKPIHINEVDADMLDNNPYISRKQAKLIIAYRTQHGKYKYINQIKIAGMLSQKEIEKIEPYISF